MFIEQLVNTQESHFSRSNENQSKIKCASSFQIIVYCREREDRRFYFPCDQWLAKDEGDGLIVRQLTATTDSSAAFEGH